MNRGPLILVHAALALALLPACREHPADHAQHGHARNHGREAHAAGEGSEPVHDDGHGHEHEKAAGAGFREGAGIQLSEEARATIGLETAPVSQQKLALQFPATARVFHAAHQHGGSFPGHKDGHAYANAMISSGTADLLRAGQPVALELPGVKTGGDLTGRIKSLDRETAQAIGQVEAVIEIPDPGGQIEFGAFLTARFAGVERHAVVIPRSALVDAATGQFVYVQNGERWLRKPVNAGGATEQFVEILAGLQQGEVVVTKGALDLWLVELRFTKGGGHSH